MNRRQQKSQQSLSLGKIMLFAGIMLIAVAAWHFYDQSAQADTPTEAHIPSAADDLTIVKIDSLIPQQLVQYRGMNLSFNPRLHIPNWVAWELTDKEVDGHWPRASKFATDPSVEGCPETYDYNYSGYDRGHMAPAGDMKWDSLAMAQTFYLTNICPQVKSLNTGAWKRLEEKCRTWAKTDGRIIIVCGPVPNDKIREYVGDTRVAVPRRFFKVILSPDSKPARGIGFVMPNGKVPGGLQTTAMSIDQVEAITGYDFFSALPDDIENDVESQCDFHYWSTKK